MIDQKTAREAMTGFSGMPGLPDSREALKARTDAMKSNARSAGHAARVVKALREQEKFYPSVQAIVEMCQNTPDDAAVFAASSECPYCHGDLWITVYSAEFPHISAAWRCTHQGPPPSSAGPVIAPAVAKHYRAEGRAA